ncbi:MAG: hypothetical protein KJ574_00370 [Nanoarchaeota archaeon]|nr:hypothetical protein [Nanoarchaeota archaeon]
MKVLKFLRKNKRAIELSINFVVLLILGIAMFAGGLAFVSKFFLKAKDIRGSLDSQTEKQIEAMLDSGSAFVIPIHSKEVSRTKYVTYGVGIYNDGRNEAVNQFGIEISFDSAFSRSKTPLCQAGSCGPDAFPIIKPGMIQTATIMPGEKHSFLVLVEVPPKTLSGTYIFNVASKQGGIMYEPSLQLIVKVV